VAEEGGLACGGGKGRELLHWWEEDDYIIFCGGRRRLRRWAAAHGAIPACVDPLADTEALNRGSPDQMAAVPEVFVGRSSCFMQEFLCSFPHGFFW
jgi:hypothetical protein